MEVCGEKLREDEQVRPISAATSGASVGWVNEVAPVPASVGNQQPGDRCRAKERRARSDPSADSNSPTERKLHKLTSQGSLSAKHVDLKQLLVDRSGAGNVEDKVPSILPSHAFCRSKRETSSGVSVDAAIQGGKQVELTTALSKIQALMGMVQTQVRDPCRQRILSCKDPLEISYSCLRLFIHFAHGPRLLYNIWPVAGV